jgi:predicted NBD/HSP70 family sugar kinase
MGYLPRGGDGRAPHRRWGALEEAAAASGMVRTAHELGMSQSLSALKVFNAARRGDATARQAIAVEAERLALAIATVTPILDPELVVLGGGIGRNGDLLLDPIERELRRWSSFHPRVVTSALGDDGVLQGAVATALQAARERVFSRSPARAMEA